MLFQGRLYALKEVKDKKEHEILLAVTGEWNGHHSGAFRVDKLDIQRMKENFDSRKIDLVVDYEHQSLWGGEAPAAGWITEVWSAKDDSELWGKVKWTDRALEYIKNEEYRYLSPVFNFSAVDQKTGANIGVRLESVALTNTPFLDELGEVKINKNFNQLIKEQNMADKNPNTQPEGRDADNSVQYEAQIAELKNQLNASQTELESLRTQIAEAKVEAAIVANKIPTSQKEWALGYAKANLAGFEEFLKGAVVPQQKLNLPNDMFENKSKSNEIDIVKYALGEE
ncbi:phage protease [Campylobacter sp. FOBRC14]|uniref:phage protease n=1 Tax=Campylobacter sp. FOBRC14 TaxID=936554 RepID=UPI00027A369D|nr:phage protease [Campylobacter sp. FOBRC14]EJP75718.1 Mu-like prophage I domain protein [Campylobacter sp. FOBRC14]